MMPLVGLKLTMSGMNVLRIRFDCGVNGIWICCTDACAVLVILFELSEIIGGL